ncbi:hypothetical protein B9479_002265 [Cryptococcus floricola]|uniref:Uncharacterized protein n=1 Tax=Cryptococcus floricola TaxID=2591691 RepID=A0A5D3B411_9TREE|nr:hypothetical protein B9479_002265 [Cryptococcus floricola]
MSAPEATGTRQRVSKLDAATEEHKNPSSLSANPSKKVERNKPNVKPPFIDVSMNKFLTYLVLSLLVVLSFYVWRFTVWAHNAGGYWALMTGNHISPAAQAAREAASAASASSSVAAATASSVSKAGSKSGAPSDIKPKPTQAASNPEQDIQSQIFQLASALGIKPAELSSAIRPLVDPSAPDPAEKVKHEAEVLKAEMEAKQKENENQEGGVLDMLGEALLD